MSAHDGVAFRSDDRAVLDAWAGYRVQVEAVRARRAAMSERYGRALMVNRLGFGHGTRVVGFEQIESDVDGQILGDNGELRVPKKGPPYSTVVPNVRRAAGKALGQELGRLNLPGPVLPGMPEWQLVGLHSLAPALFEHEGAVWAFWSDDVTDVRSGGEVDLGRWSHEPLSAYFAAKESHEATDAREAS